MLSAQLLDLISVPLDVMLLGTGHSPIQCVAHDSQQQVVLTYLWDRNRGEEVTVKTSYVYGAEPEDIADDILDNTFDTLIERGDKTF